jgi:spermidine/putrescine transport system permease protein
MKANKRLWVLLAPIYIFTLVFVAFPILYMFLLSFLERDQTWGVEFSFTAEHYLRVLEPLYRDTFKESFLLAFQTSGLCILFGYPMGYFMSRVSARWKRRLLLLITIPFWVSALLRLYGWIIVFQSNGVLDKILMGLSVTEKPLKLLYSYPAVLVGMIYALLPFMVLAVYSSAEKLDFDLVEAARDLGASRFFTFRTIILPLTLPGLLSGIILTFVPSMGLFFISEILGGNKIVLVGTIIQEQLTRGRNLPFAAAMSAVLMILTMLLMALYRKITGTTELEGLI